MKILEDVKRRIQNYIFGNINQKDLVTICQIFEIPHSANVIQQRIFERVIQCSDLSLLHQVLYILNRSTPNAISERNNQITYEKTFIELPYQEIANPVKTIEYNPLSYCLTNESLRDCPIDIKSEITDDINCRQLFIPSFTKYPSSPGMLVPTPYPNFNGRTGLKTVQIPFIATNTVVSPSAFYCSQVVLHPLSLLIPKPLPDVSQQNSRVMSKIQIYFTLSKSVQNLLCNHRVYQNGKYLYKWQVVLRFGVYNWAKPFPNYMENERSDLPECMPPYLSIWVNNGSVPLWDILPSNSIVKEGKRHARPVNISDYMKFPLTNEQGVRQVVNINWWQTPGVYQYYYFGIFLERKVSVGEYLNRFKCNLHHIRKPMAFTLQLIQDKFSSNSQFANSGNDDDIVISSVLPVSLLCPVGKSRITCPLRAICCQHLQCFDAHLYLLMNERRSVWKCPVCDGPATINDLFVDEYFCQILKDFGSNENISEVNINSDGSYTPVIEKDNTSNSALRNDNAESKTKANNEADNEKIEPVILLESDDDDDTVEDNEKFRDPNINKLEVRSHKENLTNVSKISTIKNLGYAIDLTFDSDDSSSSSDSASNNNDNNSNDNSVINNDVINNDVINNDVISSFTVPPSSLSTFTNQSDTQNHNSVQQFKSQYTDTKPTIDNVSKLPFNPAFYIPNNQNSNMSFGMNNTQFPIHKQKSLVFPASRHIYPKIQPNNPTINLSDPSSRSMPISSMNNGNNLIPQVPLLFPNQTTINQNSVFKNLVLMNCQPNSTYSTNSISTPVLNSYTPQSIPKSHSFVSQTNKQLKPLAPSSSSIRISSIMSQSHIATPVDTARCSQNLLSSHVSSIISDQIQQKKKISRNHEVNSYDPKLKIKKSSLVTSLGVDRRRSSRIQTKSKITYCESSSSGDDDGTIHASRGRKRMRVDDSSDDDDEEDSNESVNSFNSNKRRRLTAVNDCEIYTNSKSVENQELLNNSKYPIVVINRLDTFVLNHYLKQNENKPTDDEESTSQLNDEGESNGSSGCQDQNTNNPVP